MEAQTVLSVKGLSIAFPGKQQFTAVDNISFSIGRGETLAIVGESGSGKSLTALSLMGLHPKNAIVSGEIDLYAGDKYSLADDAQGKWQYLRGGAIGMVFQEPMSSLNPIMKTGEQLVESILTHQRISAAQAKRVAIDWLEKVQLPNPARLFNRYPHQLSGGQKQRVMIAMAMCNNPALLIADEPTTALDVTVQREIVELMHRLQQEHNTAMIFITHDLSLAAEIADNVLVMYRGQVMEQGTAANVLRQPVHPYTRALVSCKPSAEHKGQRLPIVADFMEAADNIPETTVPVVEQTVHSSTDVVLRVNNLKVWFADQKSWLGKPLSYFKAVDGVSFDVYKGEVLGLVGESGCGKSTVSRALMGLLPVEAGQLVFNGEDLAGLPEKEWRRVRRQIQLIFQDPFASLNPRMSVGDMLMEPLKVHNIVPPGEVKKEAQRLLDLVHLPANAFGRYPHEFSGGQRQRLGIARALAMRPQLLICDESVSALDVSVQAQILNLLKELQAEFSLTYLFISHDLSVVHYISDRVLVMQAGHIVESGYADKVFNNPQHAYTRKLVSSALG